MRNVRFIHSRVDRHGQKITNKNKITKRISLNLLVHSASSLPAIIEVVPGISVAVLSVNVGTVLVVVQVELLVVGVVDFVASVVGILEVTLCGPEVVLNSSLGGSVLSGCLPCSHLKNEIEANVLRYARYVWETVAR